MELHAIITESPIITNPRIPISTNTVDSESLEPRSQTDGGIAASNDEDVRLNRLKAL